MYIPISVYMYASMRQGNNSEGAQVFYMILIELYYDYIESILMSPGMGQLLTALS